MSDTADSTSSPSEESLVPGPVSSTPDAAKDLTWRGTYLFPPRYFVKEFGPHTREGWDARWEELVENGTRIIRRVEILGRRVAITRIGGIFVEVPRADGADVLRLSEAARVVNLLLCDLALRVIVSERTGTHGFSSADVDEERAICTTTAGASGYRRRLGQQVALTKDRKDEMHLWQHALEEHLDEALANPVAPRLERVHKWLPAMVLSSYDGDDPRMPGAAGLVDAWMVVEQLLNHLWDRVYVPRALNQQHKVRLRDFRNFTTNQRAEVLLAAGILPADLYAPVQEARKSRNDLAHSMKVKSAAAFETGETMRKLLFFMLRTGVI